MKCDSSQAGTVMECPTCFQKITAPQASTSDEQKFILTGTKMGERPGSSAALPDPKTIPARKGFSFGVIIAVVIVLIGAAAVFVFRGNFLKPAASAASAGDSNAFPRAATDVPADKGDNLALQKPAFASSQEPQNPIQNGNDGNSQTRWCASNGNVPQWWTVDLGSTAVITKTRIIWEQDAVYKYAIQVSTDNLHWIEAVDKTNNATSANMNADTFSASGRYVRIVITELPPNVWASFYEFRAFGHHTSQP